MSSRTGGRSAGNPPAARRFTYKTGLCEGTHVMTLQGSLPVEYLVGGDRVVTRNSARTLRHVACRALTDCPISVRRGALGPGRPTADMYLAPDQGVQLRDWRARVLCGSDQLAVPVSRLCDGKHIVRGEHPGELRVYELEFTHEQVIYAEGAEVMSATLPAPAEILAVE